MSYTQSDLIDRTMAVLLSVQKKDKVNIKMPDMRFKNHRTTVSNFIMMCQAINRSSESDIRHIKNFLENDMRISTSLDGGNNLVIVGRIKNIDFQKCFTRYFEQFVQCKSCKSQVTSVVRRDRLWYIKCDRCDEMNCIKDY